MTDVKLEQRLAALQRANVVRAAGARVKAAVRSGDVSLGDAIAHEDAASVPVGALLACQRRWGARRAERVCAGVPVRASKRVGELTERQRREVVRLAGGGGG